MFSPLKDLFCGGIELFESLINFSDPNNDMVIEIDNICNLPNGWNVKMEKPGIDLPSTRTDMPRNLVSMLGQFNCGKTFVLSQLRGEKMTYIPSTKYLRVKLPLNDAFQKFFSIDMKGSDSYVTSDNCIEEQATEAFLSELVLKLTTIPIIVVNTLRHSDLLYLESILHGLHEQHGDTCQLFLVHNFFQTRDNSEMAILIEKEICKFFNATQVTMEIKKDWKTKYWKSSKVIGTYTQKELQINHFVLAHNGSLAGMTWNQDTFMTIRHLIEESDHTRRSFNLIEDVVSFTNEKLECYVKVPVSLPKVIFDAKKNVITLEQPKESISFPLSVTDQSNLNLSSTMNITPYQTIKLELLRFNYNYFRPTISTKTTSPLYNLIETEHFYDLHLNLAGTRVCNEKRPEPHFEITPYEVKITSLRKNPHKFDIQCRKLRQDMAFGEVVLNEHFSVQIEEEYDVDTVGDMYYFRFYKQGHRSKIQNDS
jgi:hypothetical protein